MDKKGRRTDSRDIPSKDMLFNRFQTSNEWVACVDLAFFAAGWGRPTHLPETGSERASVIKNNDVFEVG